MQVCLYSNAFVSYIFAYYKNGKQRKKKLSQTPLRVRYKRPTDSRIRFIYGRISNGSVESGTSHHLCAIISHDIPNRPAAGTIKILYEVGVRSQDATLTRAFNTTFLSATHRIDCSECVSVGDDPADGNRAARKP